MEGIYLDRAENEILAAKSLKRLSESIKDKRDFELPDNTAFYSSVISHSYYAIFYAAKSILLKNSIKTSSPNVHGKTFDAFRENLVETGILDVALLKIYKEIILKADDLLEIFKDEKTKRGRFTYAVIPQTNKEPADDSVKNAIIFVSNIRKVMNA